MSGLGRGNMVVAQGSSKEFYRPSGTPQNVTTSNLVGQVAKLHGGPGPSALLYRTLKAVFTYAFGQWSCLLLGSRSR